MITGCLAVIVVCLLADKIFGPRAYVGRHAKTGGRHQAADYTPRSTPATLLSGTHRQGVMS